MHGMFNVFQTDNKVFSGICELNIGLCTLPIQSQKHKTKPNQNWMESMKGQNIKTRAIFFSSFRIVI